MATDLPRGDLDGWGNSGGLCKEVCGGGGDPVNRVEEELDWTSDRGEDIRKEKWGSRKLGSGRLGGSGRGLQ